MSLKALKIEIVQYFASTLYFEISQDLATKNLKT